MKKIVLTFGLIAGGILSVMMVLTTVIIKDVGFDHGELIGYTSMVAAFLTIFFGIRAYRDQINAGAVSFGRAFTIGILITAIGAVLYVATWQVVSRVMWPDFAEKYAAHMIEKARASGSPPEKIAEQEKQMAEFTEMYKKPLYNIAFTFLEPLPVGIILTLVSAGILRRKTVLAA